MYTPDCVSVSVEIWMLVLACTLPLPAGYFMPMFVLGEEHHVFSSKGNNKTKQHIWFLLYEFGVSAPGAAGGRLLGEGVAHVFSTGVVFGHHWDSVYPGVYALAGKISHISSTKWNVSV